MSSELFGRTHELFLQQSKGMFPTEIDFPLLPSNKTITQGHINMNMIVESRNRRLYILRQENQEVRAEVMNHVRSEYEGAGFLKNPQNGFRMRNAEEQKAFSKTLQAIGISTPEVYYGANGIQVIELLQNVTSLSDLWLNNDENALEGSKEAISTIIKMHAKDIVAGDRWGPNELVGIDGKVNLIDFDIEIWGPDAKEFDLANLLYHTSYFVQAGNKDRLLLLWNLYISLMRNPAIHRVYDREILLKYMKGYAEFFASDKAQGSPLYYRWDDPRDGVHFFEDLAESI